MNKSTKSHNHASEDQPSPIELQLKQMRPRAARVDLSFLSQSVSQPPQARISPTTWAGFTSVQLATAIAASWLLGAMVGGGCIFFAMTTNAPVIAQDESAYSGETSRQPNNTAQPKSTAQPINTAQPSPPNTSAANDISLPNPMLKSRNIGSEWMFDLDSESAYVGTPLTVRGLSQRFAARPITDRFIATSVAHDTPNEPLTPSSPSNRLQLMQDLLSEPSFQIH